MREGYIHCGGLSAFSAVLLSYRQLQQQSETQKVEQRKQDANEYARALVNWDPSFPGETIDYYAEYMQRHASLHMTWLQRWNDDGETDMEWDVETTGVALLSSGDQNHTVASCSDGSIIIWDAAKSIRHRDINRSQAGMLFFSEGSDRTTDGDDINSVESISINQETARGYFATGSRLHEIDLRTMSRISSREYLNPITTLSTQRPGQPLIVGLRDSIYIYDPRDFSAMSRQSISLSQQYQCRMTEVPEAYYPLSITYSPASVDNFWMSGSFPTMVQYSLRQFPTIQTAFHTGSKTSCVAAFPHKYVDREVDLLRTDLLLSDYTAMKAEPGWTAICAGEYKGKGSLELYDMNDQATSQPASYRNRQTASASKLFSVACHGGKIVYSDGDGNIRWKERDGSTTIRQCNINEDTRTFGLCEPILYGLDYRKTRSEDNEESDFVQKILPVSRQSSSSFQPEDLLLWTQGGLLGQLSFGTRSDADEEFHDAMEEQALNAAERAKHDAERQYADRMRRALQRNADEVRFVRGLGL